ncbi:hypothetical protein LEP1GSC169_1614 [Leptospira santarosai str. HAI1349]|nr:hypothetical protein LEP1GSC169_1614 [Leptospira santarosai str. HAI1349]
MFLYHRLLNLKCGNSYFLEKVFTRLFGLTRIFFNGTTKQKNKTQTIIPKEPSLECAGDSCDWVGLQSERMSISRKVCRPADSILIGRNSVLNFTGIFDFQGAT